MIIVIADDITGAAEIAGAALRHGLDTVLTVGTDGDMPHSDVWVIATDTRSGSETEAETVVAQAAKRINGVKHTVFKKTDSVLRGHVAAELYALMATLNRTEAILLPQNPSKGRTIIDGIYHIDGTPLDQTAFRYDPEFPALTSSVTAILGRRADLLTIKGKPENCGESRIYIAEATTKEDIRKQIGKADANCVLAGGVDFFNALIEKTYLKAAASTAKSDKPNPDCRSIIVCGSTQSGDISQQPFARRAGTKVSIVPDDVFNGAPADRWTDTLMRLYAENKSVAISVGQRENAGPACAVRLRAVMADVVKRLYDMQTPDLVIIEGGATAYATISRLGCGSFTMKAEYAPGVVGMTCGQTEFILKPGSYAWGDLLQ